MKKKILIWTMVAIVAIGALCGAFFGGAAWDEKEPAGKPGPAIAAPVPPVVTNPPDYGKALREIDELKAMVADLQQPVSPREPEPVTVTVNPVINVNPVITVTVSDNDTEAQSSCLEPVMPPCLPAPCLGTFEGLVYKNNFNDYYGILRGSTISHDWRNGGPFGLTRFSIKWRGSVGIVDSGYYQFKVVTDDKVRLYVDDVCLIDKWNSAYPGTEYTARVYLTEGSHKITLKYFNDVPGGSYIHLYCQRVGY